MRRLLTTSCLTPVALLAAAPATAEIVVTGTITTTVDTRTINNGGFDNVRIDSNGIIMPPGTGPGLSIRDHESAINEGQILLGGTNNAVGVDIIDGQGTPAAFENRGLIQLDENYTPVDQDGDGDPDGPFAMASGRAGVRIIGTLPGDVVNASTGRIFVKGNSSFGILHDDGSFGELAGSLVNDGSIDVTGDSSVGVKLTGRARDIRIGGTINVTGKNATGIAVLKSNLPGSPLDPIIGVLELSGNLTVTGYRFTTPPADPSHLDADDLQQAAHAIEVGNSVLGGIHITSTGNIRALGATGLLLGNASFVQTIGPVAGSGGFGLVIDGSLLSDAVYDSIRATAIQAVGAGGADLAGGILVNGTVAAHAINARATGLLVPAGNLTAPEIRVNGTVSAASEGAQGEALAINLFTFNDIASTVSTIRNSGTIRAVANGGTSATAIASSLDSLTLIENSGTISATGALGQGNNRAIDVSNQTSGVTIRQIAAAVGKPAPSIVGNVNLGSGDDLVDLQAGTVTGDLDFSKGGADRLQLSGDASLTGNITDMPAATGSSLAIALSGAGSILGNLNASTPVDISLRDSTRFRGDINATGAGLVHIALANASVLNSQLTIGGSSDDTITLSDTAQFVGNANLGDGNNSLTLADHSSWNGSIAFGAGADHLDLSGNAAVNATALTLGAGDDAVTLSGQATLSTGSMDFGSGHDSLSLIGQSVKTGSLSFADGNDTVTLADTAMLAGNVTFAGANNRLSLAGGAKLTGTVDLGVVDNKANVSLAGSAVLTGDIRSGGATVSAITLSNDALIKGELILVSSAGNVVSLTDNARITGRAILGDGSSQLTLSGSAIINGLASFGSVADRLDLAGNAMITGGADLGNGDDVVTLRDGATLSGIDLTLQNGRDSVALTGQAKLRAATTFRDGGDSFSVAGASSVVGRVAFAGADNQLALADTATLTGDVTFGNGKSTVTLGGASLLTGKLDLGGGAGLVTIGGTSRLLGSLAQSQNSRLVVSGGTLDLTNIGNVALASLDVSNGGTLTVNISGATGSATHYIVSGVANFGTGSKLLLRPIGMFGTSAHLALITAGSITGGDNLTANQIAVPFLFKSVQLTRSATEIGLDLVRKSATELGLTGSGGIALDPIFAAATSDTKFGTALMNIDSTAALSSAVATLLPDHAGGAFETVTAGARSLARRVEGGNVPRVDHDRWAYWMDHVYFDSSKGTGNTAAFRATGWGTAGGAEVKTAAGNFGASIGYLRGRDRNSDTAHNEVRTKQYEGSLYWNGNFGNFHPYAWASDARVHFNSRRQFTGNTGTEAVVRTSFGSWHGDLVSLEGGASYDHRFGGLTVRPNLSLDYNRLHENGYQESGGGSAVDLKVNGRTSDELAGNATLNLGVGSVSPTSTWFTAELEGGRREILSGKLGSTTAQFAGGSPFTLTPEGRDSGWIGRARASIGRGAGRISGEVSAEQQNGKTNVATRVSLQVAL